MPGGVPSEDELMMMEGLQQPGLLRGYSDQKRHYFKGLSSLIFRHFRKLEADFDFRRLIQEQKEIQKQKVLEEI